VELQQDAAAALPLLTPDSSSVLPNWQLVLEAAFIDCANMLDYSVNNIDPAETPAPPCQLCLLNKACSWCPPPAAAERSAERYRVKDSSAGGCVLTSELMSEGGVPHQCHSRYAVQCGACYRLALYDVHVRSACK
jgi:hypothetical protein